MVMLLTVFWVTVTGVLAITPPLCACTVATPNDTAVSRPALVIVATLVGVVLQVTEDVTSPVVLFP
jgi:hypothetical protein